MDGGNLYVADTNNNKIRKINLSSGAVTTIAGPPPGSTVSGYLDESGNAARFYSPSGITTDGSNLYIVDKQNHVIRMMTISTGVTTTIAGFLSGDEEKREALAVASVSPEAVFP